MKFIQLLENWSSARKYIKVKSPLFHGTKTFKPLADKKLMAGSLSKSSALGAEQDSISVTRNLSFLLGDVSDFGDVIIVLDGDAIKKKYKVSPYQFQGKGNIKHYLGTDDESEERIHTKQLPLSKYMKGVIVVYRPYMKSRPLKQWATWKKRFKLPFDILVYKDGKYSWLKDLVKNG